jgi:hypothetical protein
MICLGEKLMTGVIATLFKMMETNGELGHPLK